MPRACENQIWYLYMYDQLAIQQRAKKRTKRQLRRTADFVSTKTWHLDVFTRAEQSPWDSSPRHALKVSESHVFVESKGPAACVIDAAAGQRGRDSKAVRTPESRAPYTMSDLRARQ